MKTRTSIFAFAVSAAVLAGMAANVAGVLMAPKPGDKQETKPATYARDIRPIFEKSCFKCHGPEKQKAKFRLDSLEAALKGGKDGKVIEPGNSSKSLLFRAVTHVGDEDIWMPPIKLKDKNPPLAPPQTALIKAWIDQGAK